jgi:hypothetical protein
MADEQENQEATQNKRTPEEIEKQVADVLGDVEEPVVEQEEPEQPAEEFQEEPAEQSSEEPVERPSEEPTEEPTPEKPVYNPAWDILKKKLSTEENPYELPENIVNRKKPDGTDLTPEEEFDELVDHIVSNVEIEEQDPFIARYKAEKAKVDFNFDEFVKNFRQESDVFSLPSKDYLFNKMKKEVEAKKADWTDDEITEFLESKNKVELDLMANQAKEVDRKAMAQGASAKQKQYEAEAKQKREAATKDLNTKIASQASVLIKDMMNESSIGGIPHGQADIDEFAPYFNELVSINPATGRPKLNDLFNDDKTLYRALYMLYKADKGALTDFKESYKQEVLNKTGLGKRTEGGTQRTVRVPKPDDFVS